MRRDQDARMADVDKNRKEDFGESDRRYGRDRDSRLMEGEKIDAGEFRGVCGGPARPAGTLVCAMIESLRQRHRRQ
jgi:hypothetical protein